MAILVVSDGTAPDLARQVGAAFAAAGVEVTALSQPGPDGARGDPSDRAEPDQPGPDRDLAWAATELVVWVADQVGFGDGGGPGLRRVAAAAGRRLVPMIVVAGQCWISTREWRTLGVEAGYQVTDPGQLAVIASTWCQPVRPA
jgi:hypothetical protein